MTTVHLVHGFNVHDGGAGTTDTLIPYLNEEGFSTLEHDYGTIGLFGAWFGNPVIARGIADHVEPGDIGCGHSNGCTVLVRAAVYEAAMFAGLILINPALDHDINFPPQLKWIHVYWNKGDRAVRWAQIIPDFLNKLWGDMGARGHTGDDPRVRNYDCGRGRAPAHGHSDLFAKKFYWHPLIASRARREIDRYAL
ncbi:MAG: hypothetical protein Q8R92_16890 [Deltaproteobacteria bacterium]|nr:hypothetical protein [Deltaproteobacteria bacterium]